MPRYFSDSDRNSSTEKPVVVASPITTGMVETNLGGPISTPIVAYPVKAEGHPLGDIIDILADLGGIVLAERAADTAHAVNDCTITDHRSVEARTFPKSSIDHVNGSGREV